MAIESRPTRRIAPLDVERFFERHFTKVGDQTRHQPEAVLGLARRHGLPARSIAALRERLPGADDPLPARPRPRQRGGVGCGWAAGLGPTGAGANGLGSASYRRVARSMTKIEPRFATSAAALPRGRRAQLEQIDDPALRALIEAR